MNDDGPQGHVPRTNSAWAMESPEPSTVLCVWPEERPPTDTEVIAALDRAVEGAVDVIEDLSEQHDELQWAVVAKVHGLECPVIVWCEALHADAVPHDMPDVDLGRCRWTIGTETVLDPEDPLRTYRDLMRALGHALPHVPAVLDVNASSWLTRPEIESHFLNDPAAEPAAEVLWVIHAISREQPAETENTNAPVWLHTHGLRRCGCPDLEMLEVPHDMLGAAGTLLNNIASLLLERDLPEPGTPFEIGTDLYVALQPWQDVVPFVSDAAPGGAADRPEEDDVHTGVRAVICAPSPEGSFRKLWVWPRDVIDRLDRGEAAVYLTTRETERQAHLARGSWDQLATAFAAARVLDQSDDGVIVFGIKAGLTGPEAESGREHLWFRASHVNADQFTGELMNQPLAVSMSRGAEATVALRDVSDWRVMTADGVFGPEQVAELWSVIDALRAAAKART